VEAGRAQRSVARLQTAAVLAAALPPPAAPPPGERAAASPGGGPQAAQRAAGADLLPAPSPVFRSADAGAARRRTYPNLSCSLAEVPPAMSCIMRRQLDLPRTCGHAHVPSVLRALSA